MNSRRRDRPRRVSEMPALAAAALAAVTPGQTRTRTPNAARWAISSAARPKIEGSPPLRRTTRSPSKAASSSRSLIDSWPFEWRPDLLPTGTIRAPSPASASTPVPTSASKKITLAAWISFSALRVSRSGSPGPAPTSQTSPGAMSSAGCIYRLLRVDQLCDRRAARAAIGAGAQGRADLRHAGQALLADRGQNRLHADVEADAKDRPAVGFRNRGPAGEEIDGRRCRIGPQFAGNPVARRQHALAAREQRGLEALLLIEDDDAGAAAPGIHGFGPGARGQQILQLFDRITVPCQLVEPAAAYPRARPPETAG